MIKVLCFALLAACSKPAPRQLALAVGAVELHGKGSCTAAGAAVTSEPLEGKDRGIKLTAVQVGEAKVDCDGTQHDTTIVVREAAKLELRPRDGVTRVKLGETLPWVCFVAFGADGRELSTGNGGLDYIFVWSEHVQRIEGAKDHGMGAAVFGTAPSNCSTEFKAVRAGVAVLDGRWNGKQARASIDVVAE